MKHITLLAAACTVKAPAPYGPCPTPTQVEWQRMETNLFIHFGPNTFSGKEWGDGTEPEDIFNPTDMDCRQWAQVAKETTIGYKRILLIPTITADAVRIHITEADACPVLNRLALYMDDIYRP